MFLCFRYGQTETQGCGEFYILQTLSRNGSFHSWLNRIAINACFDELRRCKRHPVLPLESEEIAEERPLPFSVLEFTNILAEKKYERHEIEHVVQQALNQLDADQRVVVVLVDLREFDYQEAARIGTVKSRLARGRIRLQQFLSKSGNIKLSE